MNGSKNPNNRPPNKPSKAWKVRQLITHKEKLRKMAKGFSGAITYAPYWLKVDRTGPLKMEYNGEELLPPDEDIIH